MTRTLSLSRVLRRMKACPEARKWVRRTRNKRFANTWNSCRKENWMWWLLLEVSDYIPQDARRDAYLSRTCAELRLAIPADMMEHALLKWWEEQEHGAVWF